MSDTPDVRTGRVVIVGGVAGGMSTATRLRRLDAGAHITVLERSGHVSFANCGLPYFVGGLIEKEDDLTLQTPEQLFARFRLDVRVNDEVVDIDPKTAVVIGAGFIGLEMAENLVGQGIDVTIVEATPQVLPPLDPELAILVSDELTAHGVHVATGASVASIEESSVVLSDGRVIAADLVVGAIGVRPDVRLAELAGLALGPSGGIAINWANQTNDPDVYAVGDA